MRTYLLGDIRYDVASHFFDDFCRLFFRLACIVLHLQVLLQFSKLQRKLVRLCSLVRKSSSHFPSLFINILHLVFNDRHVGTISRVKQDWNWQKCLEFKQNWFMKFFAQPKKFWFSDISAKNRINSVFQIFEISRQKYDKFSVLNISIFVPKIW